VYAARCNLSLSVADHDLRLLFSPFGHVVRAQVARSRMGLSLRFGYLAMEHTDEANFARPALDGATLIPLRFGSTMLGTTVWTSSRRGFPTHSIN
jgi:hypothetical protein